MTATSVIAPSVISTTEKQELDNDRSDELKDLKQKRTVIIVWQNVILIALFHVGAIYGVYQLLSVGKWQSWLFYTITIVMGGLGVTAGAHRLWTHKSYKAKLPLRIFLSLCHTSTFQKSTFDWVRDHRLHHKFCETDADPSDASRGFFYSQMGWLMMKKQKELLEKAKTVDFSDVLADPVIAFQRRFYLPLAAVFVMILPVSIPYYFWNEQLGLSIGMACYRVTLIMHATSFVNSIAHIWGMKPYDTSITATDGKFVEFWAIGEGYHNYHHTFPWDYAASEFGQKLNFTTFFIDSMANIGLVYDRKSASPELINQRKYKTGDGSYFDEKERIELSHKNKSN